MTDRVGDEPNSRYPMSFGDAIAALFRRKPKFQKGLDSTIPPLSRPGPAGINVSPEIEPQRVTVPDLPDAR